MEEIEQVSLAEVEQHLVVSVVWTEGFTFLKGFRLFFSILLEL